MNPVVFVVLGLLLLPLLYVALIYNLLVKARAHVAASWSGVDLELSRRHDLIPNLVSTAKGLMAHERELFEEVTALREQAQGLRPGSASAEQRETERALGSALGRIHIRAEDYPELKSDRAMRDLMAELAHTEDRIAAALRYYNGNVRDLNVRCETIPSNALAAMFGFESAEYFQLDDDTPRRRPDLTF